VLRVTRGGKRRIEEGKFLPFFILSSSFSVKREREKSKEPVKRKGQVNENV
jgi:hypothetical protein